MGEHMGVEPSRYNGKPLIMPGQHCSGTQRRTIAGTTRTPVAVNNIPKTLYKSRMYEKHSQMVSNRHML